MHYEKQTLDTLDVVSLAFVRAGEASSCVGNRCRTWRTRPRHQGEEHNREGDKPESISGSGAPHPQAQARHQGHYHTQDRQVRLLGRAMPHCQQRKGRPLPQHPCQLGKEEEPPRHGDVLCGKQRTFQAPQPQRQQERAACPPVAEQLCGFGTPHLPWRKDKPALCHRQHQHARRPHGDCLHQQQRRCRIHHHRQGYEGDRTHDFQRLDGILYHHTEQDAHQDAQYPAQHARQEERCEELHQSVRKFRWQLAHCGGRRGSRHQAGKSR